MTGWKWGRAAVAAAVLGTLAASPGASRADELSQHYLTFSTGGEARLFYQDPLFPDQNPQDFSAFFQLDYRVDFNRTTRFTVTPFFRLDTADPKRTHFDLREAMFLKVFPKFELRVGVGKVFWGVLESIHLVDIVNQVDLVEDTDIRSQNRLGQPMVRLTASRSWGMVDFIFMPYFRDRTFPGKEGRLRSELPVQTGLTEYESSMKQWHPDFAIRYSHTIGKLDFGVYYFRGTSREPSFNMAIDNSFAPVLVPFYQIINQGGLDAQWTTGPWLFKWESIVRQGLNNANGDEETYVALGGGVEYTFYRVFGSKADVGLLFEVMWDSRGSRATTAFENDLFFGFRIALNDTGNTELVGGIYQDWRSSERSYFIELSRRIGDHFTVAAKGRFTTGSKPGDILYSIRNDNYFILQLTYRIRRKL